MERWGQLGHAEEASKECSWPGHFVMGADHAEERWEVPKVASFSLPLPSSLFPSCQRTFCIGTLQQHS